MFKTKTAQETEIILLLKVDLIPKKYTLKLAKKEVKIITIEEKIEEFERDIIEFLYPDILAKQTVYVQWVVSEFYRITFDRRLKQFPIPRQPKEFSAIIKAEANLWKITLKMLQDLSTVSDRNFSAFDVLKMLLSEKILLPVSINVLLNERTKTDFLKQIKWQNGRLRERENPFLAGSISYAVVEDAIENSERYSVFHREAYTAMLKARVRLVQAIENCKNITIYGKERIERRGRPPQKRVGLQKPS